MNILESLRFIAADAASSDMAAKFAPHRDQKHLRSGMAFFAAAAYMILFGQAQAAQKVTYHYGPEKVELAGVLVQKILYGPPGYGEDPKHDRKEEAYILRLPRPIAVVPAPKDKENDRHDNVTEVQVVNMKKLPLKTMLKKNVTVRGTLFSAQTGHHHTEVLIEAEEASLSSGGAVKTDSPDEIVSRYYRDDTPANKDIKQYARDLARYFDDQLAGLIVKDYECNIREKGICVIDFMIKYDAQDDQITDLKIGQFDASKGTVDVRFSNFGKPVVIVYAVSKTPSGWRISDIRYKPDRSLLKMLQDGLK